MRRQILVHAATALLVMAAAAACGGDDNGDDANGDATPGGAVSSAQPAVTRTPPPVAGGGEVRSADLGYSATIPAGWSAQAQLSPPGTLTDMFVGPSTEPIPPTIQVRCTEQPKSDGVATVLTAIARVDPGATLGAPVTVAGREAMSVTFTAGTEPQRVERRDVYFVDERCQWMLSLAVPEGSLAEYAAAFDAFVVSFSTS
jgi:hypothetical protein